MIAPHELAIEKAKIESCLLNTEHPRGSSKAKFFIGHGYEPNRPDVLARDPVVCSIWELRDDGILWLVTAYPG